MQTAKEKTANAAASAKAGMEKTKASVDEKVSIFVFFLFNSLFLLICYHGERAN